MELTCGGNLQSLTKRVTRCVASASIRCYKQEFISQQILLYHMVSENKFKWKQIQSPMTWMLITCDAIELGYWNELVFFKILLLW